MRVLFCVLFFLSSCSHKNTNEKNEGHYQLYSKPHALKDDKLTAHEKKIVIISTNDLPKDKWTSEQLFFHDNQNRQKLSATIGGKKIFLRYLEILRSNFKNTILLDSGSVIPHNTKKLKSSFYDKQGYDAITLGLGDFNARKSPGHKTHADLFRHFSKNSKTPLVLSNLYELRTGRGVEWKGSRSHMIKRINGIKLGIIGLIPDDVVKLSPINNRVGLFVENMLQSTIRHASILRSLGAELIVVITNQGVKCGNQKAQKMNLPVSKTNFDPYLEDVCDLESSLGQYLKRLPPNIVDVVAGGRVQQKMANVINGILVISSLPGGRSLSFSELVFDTKLRRINLQKSKVHQPVLLCHEFFKETEDCYWEDKSVNHSEKVDATFLGVPILKENN